MRITIGQGEVSTCEGCDPYREKKKKMGKDRQREGQCML